MLSILATVPTLAKIEELELDASISEGHEYRNRVTTSPVEDGGEVTDHVQLEPFRLSMEGEITNSPIKFIETSSIARAGARGDRVNVALDILKRIRNNREAVTIVTGLQTYENMMITSLSIPRSGRIGQVLRFSSEWQQVTFASTEVVTVEKINDTNGSKKQGAPKNERGKQNTSEADAQKTESGSVLYKLLKGITG